MNKKTLLILAAGMGSRYGGLKQLDGLGPMVRQSSIIQCMMPLKYGFNKLVFVIRPHFEQEFKESVSSKYASLVEVHHVYQEVDTPIEGVESFPEEKSHGAQDTLYLCQDAIKEPFAVINADDYYGKEAFVQMADFLDNRVKPNHNALIGYKLSNTLSDNGSVSRGVCEVDDKGNLVAVNERTKIAKENGVIYYIEDEKLHELADSAVVSMNFWGFHPYVFLFSKRIPALSKIYPTY
jgi:dTDP-glucose pyrophosphorylase